jgi:hypothetical protein
MERDELLRLVGEQTLLQKERAETSAAFLREKTGLAGFLTALSLGVHEPGWLERESARLARIHEMESRLAEIDGRIAALKQVTGV